MVWMEVQCFKHDFLCRLGGPAWTISLTRRREEEGNKQGDLLPWVMCTYSSWASWFHSYATCNFDCVLCDSLTWPLLLNLTTYKAIEQSELKAISYLLPIQLAAKHETFTNCTVQMRAERFSIRMTIEKMNVPTISTMLQNNPESNPLCDLSDALSCDRDTNIHLCTRLLNSGDTFKIDSCLCCILYYHWKVPGWKLQTACISATRVFKVMNALHHDCVGTDWSLSQLCENLIKFLTCTHADPVQLPAARVTGMTNESTRNFLKGCNEIKK